MSLYIEFEPASTSISLENCYWGQIQSSTLSLSMLDHYDYFLKNPDKISTTLLQVYGEFIFIIPNFVDKKIRLVRDHIGVIPLYFSMIKPGRWAASTSLNTLMKHLPRLTLNRKFIDHIYNDDFSITNETIYNEIFRCPPGHLVEIKNDKVTYERYWAIDHLKKPRNDLSYSAAIEVGRAIFAQTLQTRLSQHKHISCLLSGGLDSGYIATSLSEIAERENALHKVSTLSLRFQHSPEEESAPIERIIGRLKCQTHSISRSSLLPTYLDYDPQQDPRQIFYDPSLWFFKPLLARARELKSEIVITGLGGDDVFQPGEDFISELSLLSHFKTIYNELAKENKEMGFARAIWQHLIKPSIPFFAYKAIKNIIRSKSFQFQIEARKKLRPTARILAYRFLFSGRYTFGIEQEQELAQHYGLRMSYPLLDRRFIELVASLSPLHLAHKRLNKPFLRSMSQNSMPPLNVEHISQQSYCQVRKQILLLQKSSLKKMLTQSKISTTNIDSLSEINLNSDFDLAIKDCYTALSILNQNLNQQGGHRE